MKRRYTIRFHCFCHFVCLLLAFSPLAMAQPVQPANQIYHQALRHVGKQQFDAALQKLQRAIAQDSTFWRAYLKMVDIYTYQNALDTAQHYFEDFVARHPRNPFGHHALGLVFREKRQWQQAYDSIKKALLLDLNYSAAYPDFVTVHRLSSEAEQTILSVTKAKPDFAAPYLGLAFIYADRLDYPNQHTAAQSALERDPDLLEARYFFVEAGFQMGRYDEALAACEHGLRLARQRADVENEIDLLNVRALIVNKMGHWQTAVDSLNQALGIAQEFGDKKRERETYDALTRIHWYNSNYQNALRFAQRALEIDRYLGRDFKEASDLNFLGIMYSELGDYSNAFSSFEDALKIFHRRGNKGDEGICLGNMATAYEKLGTNEVAFDLLQRATAIFDTLGKNWDKARANYLHQTGRILHRLDRTGEAMAYFHQALEIFQALKTEEHQIRWHLMTIGETYQKQGDYARAREYYEQALRIQPRIQAQRSEALLWLRLGSLYAATAEFDTARKLLERARDFAQNTNSTELLWQAESALGQVEQRQRYYRPAAEKYELAVRAIESMREKLRSEEEKSEFFVDKFQVYADLVEVLHALHQQNPRDGFDARAFLVAEKAKARALAEMLQQSRVLQNLQQIPAEFAQEYTRTARELEGKHASLSSALAKPAEQANRDTLLSLNAAVRSLERKRAGLLDELKKKYPASYRLAHPEAISVSRLQQEILGDKQCLLEYLVSDSAIYVWILTKKQLRFSAVDFSRGELENALAASSAMFQRQKPAIEAQLDHRWANLQPAGLHQLYRTLVEGPANGMLTGGMELIIVPDDILAYFPFEILVTGIDRDRAPYLIEKFPISYAPSAALLAPDHVKRRNPSSDLLAFGNPEFGLDQEKGLVKWVSSLLPGRWLLRGERFEPLPNAEREVQVIAKNFKRRRVFVGREATEENFKRHANDVRFIHLATHNLTDDRQPMYSKIVLAQTENQREDGYLQTYEVFNLHLNADLVVLSGCSSGLGRLRRGEGIIGMTRAFMYAGASKLLVSLWPVNDESTAGLMANFYRNLGKGMSKSLALQQAKIDLIQSPDWKKDPFYWGAFILIGDMERRQVE